MAVISTTNVAVVGTDLVLTIPNGTYYNDQNYLINIAQTIPATVTPTMQVVMQIGASTTNNNIVRKCGHYLYANQIVSGKNYCFHVSADAGTFVLNCGRLIAKNNGNVASIQATT